MLFSYRSNRCSTGSMHALGGVSMVLAATTFIILNGMVSVSMMSVAADIIASAWSPRGGADRPHKHFAACAGARYELDHPS